MMLIFERGDLADMCAASANFLMNRIGVRGSLKPDFIDAEVSARLFGFLLNQPDANPDVLYGVAKSYGYSRHVPNFEHEPLHIRMAFEAFAATYRSMMPVLKAHEKARDDLAAQTAAALSKAPPPHRGVLERGPRMGTVRLGMKRLGKHTMVLVRRIKLKKPPARSKRGPGGKFVKRT